MMILNNFNKVLLVGGLGAAAYIMYKGSSIVNVVKTDLNPADENNIINRNTPDTVKNSVEGIFGWLDGKGLLPGGTGEDMTKREGYTTIKGGTGRSRSGETDLSGDTTKTSVPYMTYDDE